MAGGSVNRSGQIPTVGKILDVLLTSMARALVESDFPITIAHRALEKVDVWPISDLTTKSRRCPRIRLEAIDRRLFECVEKMAGMAAVVASKLEDRRIRSAD